MTTTKKTPKTVADTTPKPCLGNHGQCPEPVLAKGRCSAHYRRWLRRPDDTTDVDAAPVQQHRGDLVPLSLRVTTATSERLNKAGGGYRIGAEVLEAWANGELVAKKTKTAKA